MKKKSLLSIFIFVISLFTFCVGVKAADLTTGAFFPEVELRNESEKIRQEFYVMKDAEGNSIYCLDMGGKFPGNNAGFSSATTKLTTEQVNAYTYIIRNVSKIKKTSSNKTTIKLTSGGSFVDLGAGENEDYVKIQLAIWYYDNGKITDIFGSSDITSKVKEIYSGIEELVNEAKANKNNKINPTVTISSPINFTYNKEENLYVSNPITLTSNSGDIDVVTLANGISISIFNESGKEVNKVKSGEKVILKFKKPENKSVNVNGQLRASVNGDIYEMTKYEATGVQSLGKLTITPKKIPETVNFTVKETTTKFSKISVVNQQELPGAQLRILNENKEVILDANGDALYEWTSTEEPHYIYGLEPGKYYLEETLAPDGYVLSNELVEFEVKDDGSITEVVMENNLEVEVPDTLSARSMLLLVIGMIDIALGIGILLYVKKNKATE